MDMVVCAYIACKKPLLQSTTTTYNSRCSLMVTHSTTNLPVRGLSMGEQTGSRILLYLWSRFKLLLVVVAFHVEHLPAKNPFVLNKWKLAKQQALELLPFMIPSTIVLCFFGFSALSLDIRPKVFEKEKKDVK
ncbi:hypothetical protein ACQKWADRAFT_305309 [Trichoderma austrokoningii]